MKQGQRLWTREKLILAINLYCKLPFGRLHHLNPEVTNLANLINRTPSSIAYKLVNFASLDPSLKARGIKGASNNLNQCCLFFLCNFCSFFHPAIWDGFLGWEIRGWMGAYLFLSFRLFYLSSKGNHNFGKIYTL